MLLAVYTDKCLNLILGGSAMLAGGIDIFRQCSELGITINSFFTDYGFNISLSVCTNSTFLVGFILTLFGLLLIFFGFFGYILGFRD